MTSTPLVSFGNDKCLALNNTTANIVLAIVGLTVVNLTFVILLGIWAYVGLTYFKCPTIANT